MTCPPLPCDLCAGTGWATYPDPFLGGALIDARCPACTDTTVRSDQWWTDWGRTAGREWEEAS